MATASIHRPEPHEVPRPAPAGIWPGVMVQRWEWLSFVHWPMHPVAVQRVLPRGLEVDAMAGAAWVGVVPFRLRLRVPGVPAVPWLSTFPEVNVRTYVRGPDGRRGIWFLSLDASRMAAVLLARRSFRLPYRWSSMRISVGDGIVHYASRRRWPGPGPAFSADIEPGPPIEPGAETDLERFLTCRWRMYSPSAMALSAHEIDFCATQVDHSPWPLRRSRILSLRESLLEAAGLPPPDGDPLVHFSRGVQARFAPRVRVNRRRS